MRSGGSLPTASMLEANDITIKRNRTLKGADIEVGIE